MNFNRTEIKEKEKYFDASGICKEKENCNHMVRQISMDEEPTGATNEIQTTTTQAKATEVVAAVEKVEVMREAIIESAAANIALRDAIAEQAANALAESQRIAAETQKAEDIARAEQAARDAAQAQSLANITRTTYTETVNNIDDTTEIMMAAITNEPPPMVSDMPNVADQLLLGVVTSSIPLTEAEDKMKELVIDKIMEKVEVGERNKPKPKPIVTKKLSFLDQIVEYVYKVIYVKK